MSEIKIPELNEEQKKAVFCQENAVVAAGAGSGKTMVLANRFAWLLTEKGCKVDEILTLTFTKKAASQMFRRIHSLLNVIAAEESGIKAKRARAALDDFIHARIQTLDSYSTAIVRQCASRYGISPEFEINPERSREIAAEEALPFLIRNRHHPAIEKLYSDNRPNDIAHNIFSEILNNCCLIDRQRDFTGDVKKQFNLVCKEWDKQITEITAITNDLKSLKDNVKEMCPDLLDTLDKYKEKNITIVKTSDIRGYFDLLLNESALNVIERAENHPIQNLLTDFLYYISFLKETKINKGKPRDNPVKSNLKLIRGLYDKFSSLVVYCMQAGLILSFMSLLDDLQTRFQMRKRAEGVLTFGDVASLSRTILLEQKDIRQSEKEAFKAIMIDEFQDNNELQKEILFLLSEKPDRCGDTVPAAEDLCSDKLFFVGDEKQSVYLFRGADVSVFRKLKNEIKSENLPLKINYRSAGGLIGAFNAIFGGSAFDQEGEKTLHEFASVFAPSSSLSLPMYEAAYTPLTANAKDAGNLSICILNGKDNDDAVSGDDMRLDATENEARFTAERIEQLLKEKSPNGDQKYLPKDIAILFRTHSSQYLFEKQLRLLGIPYTSEDINDLFYSGVVNDIMSVLFLAAHPLDSASYAEMLRSPFAGLSLSGTAACLSLRKTEETFIPFNDDPLPYLDDEDIEKYQRGKKIYESICVKAAGESIGSIISDLWYNEGYRYETEWHPNTSVYREYFDYLYHLAVNADNANQGLAVFTEYIRTLRDSDSRLRDIIIPLDRSGAVHLMTIHKSKGLEFPIVFICCCGKHARVNQTKKVYDSGNEGIVFCPPIPYTLNNISEIKKNFFWEQAKADEKRKNTAELRRLLYVAMTRAEQKLFLTGVLNITDSETDDFSVKIKNHTNQKYEEKIKKDEIYIEGDTIINNDTLFGLLLPAVSSHIPPGGLEKEGSFFDIEEIPAYTEEYSRSRKTNETILANTQEGLNEYIKKRENFYENAQVIKTPVVIDNHLTPVYFRENRNDDNGAFKTANLSAQKNFIISAEFSGGASGDVFGKVDAILSNYAKKDEKSAKIFNAGHFGTIAHACVEALLNREEAFIPSNIACLLKPHELPVLLEAGIELAKRFILSPLGKIALDAQLRENEFPFRSIYKNNGGKEIFINGVIDLFFNEENCIHAVDFKTDAKEIPEEHIEQMSFYYNAVSDLYSTDKEIRIWLYYLRTGHAVEMTKIVKRFNIKETIFG